MLRLKEIDKYRIYKKKKSFAFKHSIKSLAMNLAAENIARKTLMHFRKFKAYLEIAKSAIQSLWLCLKKINSMCGEKDYHCHCDIEVE